MCAVLAALLLCACGAEASTVQPADPYAGMVEVPSGYGTTMWVKEYDGVPQSTWNPELFASGGKFLRYTGSDCALLRGIDVSEHQGVIDWAAVASDGVDFAMIRAGYRGYSEGGMFEDACFRANLDGAKAQGIRVGVYFFSQAVTPSEAEEEADFLAALLDGYTLDLPAYYDWENIDGDDARTDLLGGGEITDCALAFCSRLGERGISAGVYAYRYLAYFQYDLSRLTELALWIGAVAEKPDFYYDYDLWQYSVSGQIAGIEGNVDLDLMLVPLAVSAPAADADAENGAAQ